jgi:hypothetical protein
MYFFLFTVPVIILSMVQFRVANTNYCFIKQTYNYHQFFSTKGFSSYYHFTQIYNDYTKYFFYFIAYFLTTFWYRHKMLK